MNKKRGRDIKIVCSIWFIIFVFVMILPFLSASPDFIYQEDANVTACYGPWYAEYPCSNTYDGNWTTSGTAQGGISNVVFNYTKPNRAQNSSLWQVKNGVGIDNLTIIQSCWDTYENDLILNITSNSANNFIDWYCFDGGSWTNLRNTNQQFIFEDAMQWEIGAVDTIPPTWRDNWTDASNLTKNGETVHFNITLEDNIEGGSWTFSFYNGIEWQNNSGSWIGINYTVLSETRTITAIKNQEVKWKWYFKDNAGNNNETPIWSFTVANSPPNQSNPLLSTPSGKNFSSENLTCYNQSTSDLDNDAVTNIYNWYKNSQSLSVLNLPFESNANDYSGNNNYGTRNGTVFTNGKVGKALNFDGIDDTVSIELTDFPISEFTFEMWFNTKEFSNNGRDLFTKYSGNDGFRSLITSSGQIESAWDIGDTFNTLTTPGITTNVWYHFVIIYNGSLLSLYLNGDLKDSEIDSGNLTIGTNILTLGFNDLATPNFNGSIDEVKVYPYALTQEQIQANYYNLEYNKIVSQETTAGDSYMCQVTPNDGEVDGITLNSSVAEIKWAITFNVTDSYYGTGLNNVLISCNQTGFNQEGDTTNPYGPYGFSSGSYECQFEKSTYYNKTINFIANGDKIINVSMSEKFSLTVEEHTWLEAIYNCLYSGDCSLYNLLLEVNQTVGKIWGHTKPTDESVIIFENITNKVVNNTQNLTIDYTVSIPIKAGYSLGAYLPVRIGYWFLDTANTTCYNQGDKPTGVEEPYCQPLIIETIGPMGGQVNFTVKLHPSLPAGNYSIKRIIDIDPLGIWYNYGQEIIGTILVTEPLADYGISLETTGENNPTNNNQQQSGSQSSSTSSSSNNEKSITNVYNIYNITNIVQENKTKDNEDDDTDKTTSILTGDIIKGLLSNGTSIIILIAVLGLIFIISLISKKLKLKNKK